MPVRDLQRVVIDLTPILPGGENGGAKVVTLELIRLLAQLAPACEFILLTVSRSHEELAAFEAANVTRLQIDVRSPGLAPNRNLVIRLRELIPARAIEGLSALYQRWSEHIPLRNSLLRHLGADLLFCPFTSPNFYDPAVPLVSIIYDLQHRYFPQFFEPSDAQQRDRAFLNACRWSRFIVCPSAYVRQTILQQATIASDRIETIPILLPHRLVKPPASESERVLASLALKPERFLLYPANFWPHKNHEALLKAFSIFLSVNAGSDLKLVLTGAASPLCNALKEGCRRASALSKAVVFPGYLPNTAFSALLYSCLAIVFPSLFEGFGMPVVEGMAASKPVLASNRTSLPEVAGDAALYFDPANPTEIADAITRVESDSGLRRVLAEKAAARSRMFGRPEEMAAHYLRVFRSATGEFQ
jgi:glycosyltransferase involved in cell wall biosynthesis